MKRNVWILVLAFSCLCMAAAVRPAAADDPPYACFYYSCGATFCGFDSECSTDDGYITNYHWSWGDGTFTNGTNSAPSHTYAAHGTYTVILTITDNAGQKTSTSLPVTF